MYVHTVYDYYLPYSGKFSREKISANYTLFAKILSANVLFSIEKDRAIALIRENIIREMLSRAFVKILSRENFPLYGITLLSTGIEVPHRRHADIVA